MGISGLLGLLKSIQKPCHLKQFAGQTLGVDAYGWLHRGTATCTIELATGKPTTKLVDYVMHRVRMLIHFGITPYLVFDGDHLPSKSGTEKDRAAKRKEAKKLGLELLAMGKPAAARQELQKGVDVTPEIARQLIEELRAAGVSYVVAPYEADSQLAYLERKGIIDGIVSEDSDLLVFGAKCLLTKLDQYGECIMINRKDFTACREISLAGWTDADFRRMAILSGCDYLPSINKMGLKTAYRLLRQHKTVERVLKALQFDGKFKVEADYLERFIQAERTFLYPWVFCPEARALVNLTQPTGEVDLNSLPYIGRFVEASIAAGVARGDLHPGSKKPITFMASSKTPFKTPAHGLRRTASMPTPKSSKPIDSFFRPRRIPLAELDVNCFTPSPSQQQVLEQNAASFTSTVAPLPTPPSSVRPYMNHTASSMNRITRTVSAPMVAPRPRKKQRLCADPAIPIHEDATPQLQTGTSRFFSSASKSAVEPSPSMRKTASQIVSKNLWSDDSIEEAMLELPDVSEKRGLFVQKRKSKKVAVFCDDAVEVGSLGKQTIAATTELDQADSQSTAGSGTDSQDSVFSAASVTTSFTQPSREASFYACDGADERDLTARNDEEEFSQASVAARRLARFSYKPRDSGVSFGLPDVDEEDLLPTKNTEALIPASSPPRSASLHEDDVPELTATGETQGEDCVPDSPVLSRKVLAEEIAPTLGKGSEDVLLIPDSDADSDAEEIAAGRSDSVKRLNLGRFAFAG